ncbi:MAG: HAD family hydrolase [Pseudomonadota bacterium]
MRVAMWSGPRNLSTAMMYSFAQRPGWEVVDEPFYAAYLAATGLIHPMQDEVLSAQPHCARKVAEVLAARPETARYEKHMVHHVMSDWDLTWLADVVNVFLIRHPARVIASYVEKREQLTLDDLGFRQQFELFNHVKSQGATPIVVDSFNVRADPEQSLKRLCAAIGVTFEPAMLSWPKGPKSYDGAWGPYWYGAVHRSTGFAGVEGPLPLLDPDMARLADAAMPFYDALAASKI